MQQYKCLIVEDESLSADLLKDYVCQVPFLQLHQVCSDAIIALDIMQKEKIDLIFLDIHLPRLKGLDFIATLKHPPHIIITTAYHEYALQGYEYNVIDYLLKPIEFSRFLTAVNKLKQPLISGIRSYPNEREFMFFNVNKKKVKVFLDEILYIESLKDYVKVFVKGGQPIVTKFQLSEIEELLTRNNFIRVHRSFIVAKDKVDAFTATDVEIAGTDIPVGRSYKDIVQAAFGGSSSI